MLKNGIQVASMAIQTPEMGFSAKLSPGKSPLHFGIGPIFRSLGALQDRPIWRQMTFERKCHRPPDRPILGRPQRSKQGSYAKMKRRFPRAQFSKRTHLRCLYGRRSHLDTIFQHFSVSHENENFDSYGIYFRLEGLGIFYGPRIFYGKLFFKNF